jgi:hypothetical protein
MYHRPLLDRVVLGKFGLCLKLISEIGGLEWLVCSEILEPPSLVMGHGGSKISEQTDHSKPPISLISFRHKPNFPNTRIRALCDCSDIVLLAYLTVMFVVIATLTHEMHMES